MYVHFNEVVVKCVRGVNEVVVKTARNNNEVVVKFVRGLIASKTHPASHRPTFNKQVFLNTNSEIIFKVQATVVVKHALAVK